MNPGDGTFPTVAPPTRRPRPSVVLAAAVIGSGALLAGCASSTTEGASVPSSVRSPTSSVAGAPPASTGAGSPAPVGASALPAATVTDVASGAPVELQSFQPADKPLLVWFWAPF